MSRARYFVFPLLLGAGLLGAWWAQPPAASVASDGGVHVAEPAAAEPRLAALDAGARRYPHATKDQAKRDAMRTRLLAAAAAAEANAKAAEAARENAGGQAAPERGNRETNDIEEFGRFIAEAIREDFVPMAKACAAELGARKPDAGGSAVIAFELLGDKSIGGVVNSADVVGDESTIHDPAFETCIRESLYGVYFDPPPAGGRATLRFPVTVTNDGKVDEQVEDFHLKDKR